MKKKNDSLNTDSAAFKRSNMSIEENKNIVRRYQEAYNNCDFDALAELVSADVLTPNIIAGMPSGLEGAKVVHQTTLIGMPDYHTNIEDLIAEGDKVVARVTMTGTHTGNFWGIPATAEGSTSQESILCELRTEKSSSIGARREWDDRGLKQLGFKTKLEQIVE
ncbi:MAG: ester cyclase [Lewinellaceae bacterium]|nr:ester cyclase [Lewinellaceae bacterium]